MNRTRLIAVAAVALLAGGGAEAGYSWNYTTSNCNATGTTSSCAMTGLAVGTPSLATTAYANTGTTGTGTGSGADLYKLETGYLSVYAGGLGVKNKDAGSGDINEGVDPEHSIDSNQRYDSVLLQFGSQIALTSMTIGWVNTDSDMTVLAYTGSGSPTGNLTNLTYSQLTSNGWTLIGHYGNVAMNVLQGINAANVASQFWLVGAFNPLVGGTTTGLNKGDDYVKLLAVAGNKPGVGTPVPEPASLMLSGVALAALVWNRRRMPAKQ